MTFATASSFAVLGWAVIVFLRRQSVSFPEGLEGSLLLLLIPLLSPQGWDYVLLMATPAVIYLANYLDKLPTVWRVLTVVAGLTIGLRKIASIKRVPAGSPRRARLTEDPLSDRASQLRQNLLQ